MDELFINSDLERNTQVIFFTEIFSSGIITEFLIHISFLVFAHQNEKGKVV